MALSNVYFSGEHKLMMNQKLLRGNVFRPITWCG